MVRTTCCAIFERMHQGQHERLLVQGFNPLAALPNKKKLGMALSKLKYMVIIDPLKTETAEFWKDFGEFNTSSPRRSRPRSSACRRRASPRRAGSFTNSGRTAAVEVDGAPSRRARRKIDSEIVAALFLKIREMYQKDGGKVADPVAQSDLGLQQPGEARARGARCGRSTAARSPTCCAARSEGSEGAAARAGACRRAAAGFRHAAGRRHDRVRLLDLQRCWTQAGNNGARRDNERSRRHGQTARTGRLSWPANRRVLYNRAGAIAGRQAMGSPSVPASAGTARRGRVTMSRTSIRRSVPTAARVRSS